MSLKKRIWDVLSVASPGNRASRTINYLILILILLNVVAVMLGSIQELEERFARQLFAFEVFSVLVFTIEYLARLWSCVVDPSYAGPFRGRIIFALTPMAIVDLLAVLPFYLHIMTVDLRFIRILRLLRLIRVAKLARYTKALNLLTRVVISRREELILTSGVLMLLLVIASCLMYEVEHFVQPDKFPNIPSAMWWAVATLTTVGYGDVYPITGLGKVIASVIAILGMGLFALPAAILASGFMQQIEHRQEPRRCPYCGKELR